MGVVCGLVGGGTWPRALARRASVSPQFSGVLASEKGTHWKVTSHHYSRNRPRLSSDDTAGKKEDGGSRWSDLVLKLASALLSSILYGRHIYIYSSPGCRNGHSTATAKAGSAPTFNTPRPPSEEAPLTVSPPGHVPGDFPRARIEGGGRMGFWGRVRLLVPALGVPDSVGTRRAAWRGRGLRPRQAAGCAWLVLTLDALVVLSPRASAWVVRRVQLRMASRIGLSGGARMAVSWWFRCRGRMPGATRHGPPVITWSFPSLSQQHLLPATSHVNTLNRVQRHASP